MDAETKTIPPNLDALIDDDAVAALVGYSRRMIPRLVAAGVLPPPITIGTGRKGERHRRRWHRGHLLDWLRARAEQEAAR